MASGRKAENRAVGQTEIPVVLWTRQKMKEKDRIYHSFNKFLDTRE
jgi:hypothetical protein